jgi:hypothetical protein
MTVVRLVIVADSAQAVRAIRETSVAADESSKSIVASDEETAAANEETSASFDSMRKGVMLLGTVAFAALGYAMDKSVKAALAWQSQQAAMQQAMKNTGTYSAANVRAINAQTQALATHGGFSESEQIPALTQLISLTGSLSAAQRLNVAATNLARGAHIDYASAISKVEAAMIGQTRGIGKLAGVIVPVTKYTYGWTAAMKAADQAGYAHAVTLNKQATAQEILGMVTKKYGDQTAAYSRTVSGALSNVRNSFEILLRQLGTMLLPTINKVAKVFAQIGSWMASHMGVVKEIAKQFVGVALAVGAIVVVWKAWTTAIKIQEALAAANPWLLALTAIALVAVEVITHWKAVTSTVVSVFNSIGSAVGGVWAGLKTGFVAVINFISKMINTFIIDPLNAVLTVGGLFNVGQSIPTIPGIGGQSPGGPTPQSARPANSSVPAVQHRAGDVHSTIPVVVNIDGRTVAETVVHHVQKRAALA